MGPCGLCLGRVEGSTTSTRPGTSRNSNLGHRRASFTIIVNDIDLTRGEPLNDARIVRRMQLESRGSVIPARYRVALESRK
jgi:hypothetical protein